MTKYAGICAIALWSSFSFAKTGGSEPSCGILRPKDGSWLKKPVKIPLQVATEKGAPSFLLYDKDQLTIGINRGDTSTAISASKGKKVIAVLVMPAMNLHLEIRDWKSYAIP